jgi:DNA-binding MarR family transcriptional regulator
MESMGEKLKQRLKQVKPVSIEQEAFLNLLLASNFIRKKFDDVCIKYGITNAQYNVLRILKGVYPEGYPRCQIIPRMIDQAPDVTRIIDNLEKQRLIERCNSDEDRRLSVTKITKKGLDLIRKMDSDIMLVQKCLKDPLTDEEIQSLSEICEKIYGHYM